MSRAPLIFALAASHCRIHPSHAHRDYQLALTAQPAAVTHSCPSSQPVDHGVKVRLHHARVRTTASLARSIAASRAVIDRSP